MPEATGEYPEPKPVASVQASQEGPGRASDGPGGGAEERAEVGASMASTAFGTAEGEPLRRGGAVRPRSD